MMFLVRITFAIVIVSLIGKMSIARADEIDVLPVQVEGDPDRLATGEIDFVNFQVTGIPKRVYANELTDFGIDDLRGDEGFNAVSDVGLLPEGYTTLAGGIDIGFDFRSFAVDDMYANLWFWEDPVDQGEPGFQDDIDFQPASGGLSLTLWKTPMVAFQATVDGADEDVDGFVIDRTSAQGFLHKHLNIIVDDGDDDFGTPVPVGIYAVQLVVSQHPPRLPESPPFVTLFNGGLGPNGEDAIDATVVYFNDLLALPGDVDRDGDVDLVDFGFMAQCLAGPDVHVPPVGCDQQAFDRCDIEGDDDVDTADFAAFALVFRR